MNGLYKKSVLVIEDHPDSCHTLKQMLRRRGLHAECAETMDEGLSCIEIAESQGHPYACVVSDLVLDGSGALATLGALQKLKARGIPVRAISGFQDPEIIEACRKSKIPLILKGTSAEGIMESVLYAIAERQPDQEIDEMIADNRSHARELGGFFHGWTSLNKFFAAAGVIVSTILGSIALGGFFYHNIEKRILATNAADLHFDRLDERVKKNEGDIASNSARIRAKEDESIKIGGKIDEMAKQLDRIEKKVEGIEQQQQHR